MKKDNREKNSLV